MRRVGRRDMKAIIAALFALPIVAFIANAWHEQLQWRAKHAAAHNLFKQAAQHRR